VVQNINLDALTIGRYAARATKTYTPESSSYRILFTRGDELLTPGQYTRSFEQSMGRALNGGYNVSDESVARAAAVGTTAFVCSEYRATTTAGIPLKVIDPNGDTLSDTMLTAFSMGAANLLANTTRSLLIWGRMYLRKRRNADGWPTGLEWINPPDEIIYKQAFDPTPLGNGLSRFEVAWRALNVEQGIVTHAASFFSNGAQPDGILTFDQPLSDDQYDKARTEWKENFRGAMKAHKTAVMPSGATYTPVQSVPKDLAMVELKDSEREDICAIFEVDPILVGLKGAADSLSANSTYSTSEVAHIRRVTLPLLKMLILPALNQQWAHRDFDKRNYYTIAVDEAAISALSEANLAKADTAVNVTGNTPVLDYHEGRKLLGYGDRDTEYLKRNPTESLALWQAGGITWNMLQWLAGVPGTQYNPVGDVVLIGGNLLPVARMLEVAHKNADAVGMPPSSPFGNLPPGNNPPPEPLAPAPIDTPLLPESVPVQEATLANGKSGILMLAMPNQPDLISLQNRVHQMLGDVPCEWNKPEDFHITLIYMPSMTDEQITTLRAALVDIETPDLSLRVGQLNVFDNVGEHALHFRIGRNSDLLDWQEELHSTCQMLGIPMSAYSEPSQYKPHITMGYSTQPIKRVPFHSSLKIVPNELRFIVDDEIVYQSANNPPVAARSMRSDMPLTIGVSFADNQFVRYAKRALSESLTAQGITAEWLPESQWRYVMAQVDEWTPSAVSAMLRAVDYGDTKKVDIHTDSVIPFAKNGDNIYFQLEADNLDALYKSVNLDVQRVGLTSNRTAAWGGILLCRVNGELDREVLHVPVQSYPLVANNITLSLGDEPYHRWNLRGVSSAQISELKNWRHKVERKGTDAPFNTEALDGHTVATFVSDALTAGVSIEDTFAIAESVLRGEYELRAYPQTEAQFIDELTTIIAAGQADEIVRRQLAARMRTIAYRLGLVAFRDGMETEGYSPESFSADELSVFRGWQADTSGYITDFGKEVFTVGITETEVRTRAQMWAGKSLRDIFLKGQILAAPKKPKMWRRNPEKESCVDCLALDGQIKTLEEWGNTILPGSSRLACWGAHCGCELVDAA
jgi:2'-5' RNA ligase